MAKKAHISVIERRLQGPSALDRSSEPIPMVEADQWVLRWINKDLRTDHLWHAVNVLGWVYVEGRDLACTLDEIGAQDQDGRITRGERGREVLMKMPRHAYRALQLKKDQENKDRTFSPAKVHTTVVNAAAATHGSQAADFLERHTPTVIDSRGPMPVDEE